MNKLIAELRGGAYAARLTRLYGNPDAGRALGVAEAFAARFPAQRAGTADSAALRPALFSAPGRTELGGNHTDHQHGHALCASVDLDLLACAAPNGLGRIRVISEGYAPVEVALDALDPQPSERGSTAALVRGMAAGVAARGFSPCGFDAWVHSNVPAGSGLSSSAAFEILIGTILNAFCCGGALDPVSLAMLGQRAENVYFDKPCGLLDQLGAAIGGAVALDFRDPAGPQVERITFDFSATEHTLCILDTGSTHADLTGDYAEIPNEMSRVARCFGRSVLAEVAEADFRAAIPALRRRCGDRAVLRALHFYDDDRTAQAEAAALRRGDFGEFLSLVNRSGLSSLERLQNISAPAHPEQQAVRLAISLGRELLAGRGAIRVHGGGFAGTVQAFVPNPILEPFCRGIEAVFGPGSCRPVHIRPVGGWVVSQSERTDSVMGAGGNGKEQGTSYR